MPQGIDLLPAVLPSERPTLDPDLGTPDLDKPFIVIVYNDDYHTFPQVEMQLQKATACTLEKAEAFAMEIHTTGRAVVFSGDAEQCEKVANVLREIKLQVETDRA
jgi:ATP-dependent Clp protease adaptor protein ClpS